MNLELISSKRLHDICDNIHSYIIHNQLTKEDLISFVTKKIQEEKISIDIEILEGQGYKLKINNTFEYIQIPDTAHYKFL